MAQALKHNYQDIFTLFFNPGEVCEIRAFGCSGKGNWEGWAKGDGIVFGYFNDPDAFAKAASGLEKLGPRGIHFTVNPVPVDFLGRAANRLKAATNKTPTTKNENIQIIRWLFIDFDPARIAGGRDLNTTKEEFDIGWQTRNRVSKWLKTEGIADGAVSAISGNGAHLYYRLPDLKACEETTLKIKTALAAISHKFQDETIEIDSSVCKPAQLTKLYGTTARKSDHTDQRPQRLSRVQFAGEACPILADIPVNEHILEKLAAYAPKETAPAAGNKAKVYPMARPQTTRDTADLGTLDVPAYLSHYGIEITKTKTGTDGGKYDYYEISRCLFNTEHKREAGISQATDGTLRYHCFHNSCKGYRFQDARAIISGQDNLAPFMTGYNPNYLSKTRPQPRPASYPTNGSAAVKAAYYPDNLPFIYTNEKGRESINPAQAADFFEDMLSPVYCTGQEYQFWKYREAGVWRPLSIGSIKRTIRTTLGDKAKPSWINQTFEVLCSQCYKDDNEIKPDPMLLNLKNGMWDIRNRKLIDHSPQYHSKIQFPVNWDEQAEADLWVETIDAIFKDDPLKADTLQDFFGYCLYPKAPFPGVIFAIGDGGNGKGVVEDALVKMLGENAVCHIGLERMAGRFGLSELRGKYVNTDSETSPDRVDVTGFKKATGGNIIQTERKGIGDISFRSFAKHWISMNQFPHVNEKTNSFFRRFTVLEFMQNFEGKACNPYLSEELETNLDGIFQWAMDGLYRVLENKCFTTPESVARGKVRMRLNANPVLTFAQEKCVVSETATVSPPALYRTYQRWCAESGHSNPLGKTKFYEEIKLNFKATRVRPANSTIEMFNGIGLLADDREC